jgi:hypothetical protein
MRSPAQSNVNTSIDSQFTLVDREIEKKDQLPTYTSPAILFEVIVVSAQNCRTRAALSGSSLRRFASSAVDLSRQSLRGGESLRHYGLRLKTAALRGKRGFIVQFAIREQTHISAFPHQIVVELKSCRQNPPSGLRFIYKWLFQSRLKIF